MFESYFYLYVPVTSMTLNWLKIEDYLIGKTACSVKYLQTFTTNHDNQGTRELSKINLHEI